MAGFDGAAAIEPLAYTGLGQYGIPDGVIPEPTNDGLVAFFTAVEGLDNPAEGVTGEDILALVQKATSAFCSGVITPEQFAAMPPRLFREFAKWLVSEFADPKG